MVLEDKEDTKNLSIKLKGLDLEEKISINR